MASRPVVEPGAEDRRQNQTGRSGVSDPRARSSGDPQNARSTVQSDAAAGNRTTRRGADGAYRRPQPAQPRPGGSADEEVRRPGPSVVRGTRSAVQVAPSSGLSPRSLPRTARAALEASDYSDDDYDDPGRPGPVGVLLFDRRSARQIRKSRWLRDAYTRP
ncbi:hypothetical protein HPB47_023650 [Ixodes persulcatus]|uniref:Uncharacterized protein n=1 Tax=Ixodes persulcatus TaxID=34615 RepID=A0AC60Q8X7_IXOPE|nr:hypothetical protein HPB47_023650 [Ixodes persulcatus]